LTADFADDADYGRRRKHRNDRIMEKANSGNLRGLRKYSWRVVRINTNKTTRGFFHGSPKNTRPLWFVPRKYPYPALRSCNSAPLNTLVRVVPGTFTLPEN